MNLVVWAIFGFLLISVFAVVSNTGQTATANIQQRFEELGCPMPSQSGLWSLPNSNGQAENSTLLQYSNFTYNYPNVGDKTLTLTCTSVHTLDGIDYKYGIFTIQPFFSDGTGFDFGVPMGAFFFVGDYVSESLFKVGSMFQLIAYILSPINFDIMGYTIADLDGISLMVVIGLYIFAYIPIGLFIYKAITPFAGLS